MAFNLKTLINQIKASQSISEATGIMNEWFIGNDVPFLPAYYNKLSEAITALEQGGGGSGDMVKSVYDVNNTGIVDDAERLGGLLPQNYNQSQHVIDPSVHLSLDERQALDAAPNAPTASNPILTSDDLGGTDVMLKTLYDFNNDGIVNRADSVLWSGIIGTPSTFPPENHTHSINDVSNLQSVLDSKASVVHQHVIADVDTLQGELDNRKVTDDISAPNAEATWSSLKINSEISNAGGGDMSTTTYVTGIGDGSAGTPVDRARYADKADYTTLDNIPTEFTPISHNHNDLYYTFQQVDDNFVDQSVFDAHTHVAADITDLAAILGSLANYTIITSDTVAEEGKGYIIIADSNPVNLTLPANTDGFRVDVLALDITNTVKLVPTSGNINGGVDYQISTINSIFQAFYTSFKGEWSVLTESGGVGGIGDAPDADLHFRVAGTWIKSELENNLPATGTDLVYDKNAGMWKEAAYTANAVTSVNGKTGAVNLDTSNVPDGLNLRYVTDAEKAAITTNTADILNRQIVASPDPAVPTAKTVSYVTKAWFDANSGSLDPNTDYRLVDGGYEVVEDKSGAIYTIVEDDLGKVLYSEDNFKLSDVMPGEAGWYSIIVNKSSSTSIEIDITDAGLSILNQIGTAVNIPAGEQKIIRKVALASTYLIS